MLNRFFKDAMIRKDEILLDLNSESQKAILKDAKTRWIEYSPKRRATDIICIDGSCNQVRYQGVMLWMADAVAVKIDNTIVEERHDFGLRENNEGVKSLMVQMEAEVFKSVVTKTSTVLVDGSLLSVHISDKQNFKDIFETSVLRKGEAIFVSKTSDTKEQFETQGSCAGDVYYYNHSSRATGFSEPFTNIKCGTEYPITTTYVRLVESLPLLKIELAGDNYSTDDIKNITDTLFGNSVSGYPHGLKMAHNICKIGTDDMLKLATMLGLTNEPGSREVLN